MLLGEEAVVEELGRGGGARQDGRGCFFLRQQPKEGRLEGDIGGHLEQSKRACAHILHKCRILLSYKGRTGDWNNGGLGL